MMGLGFLLHAIATDVIGVCMVIDISLLYQQPILIVQVEDFFYDVPMGFVAMFFFYDMCMKLLFFFPLNKRMLSTYCGIGIHGVLKQYD